MTTLYEQAARAPRSFTPQLREGTILDANGHTVSVELDAAPNRRRRDVIVPYPHTPAIAAGQRVAVEETDQGSMIVVARWPA